MEIFLDLFFYVKRFLIISWRKIRRISLNEWYYITKHLLFALIFLGVIIFNIQTTSGNITFAFEGSNHSYTTVEGDDTRFELTGVSLLGDACQAGQSSYISGGNSYDCVYWNPSAQSTIVINDELQYTITGDSKYQFDRYDWDANYVAQGIFKYYIEGTNTQTDVDFESYYQKVDNGLTKKLYELFKIVPVWKQTGEYKYFTNNDFDEQSSTNYFIVNGTVYKRFYETALTSTLDSDYFDVETVWSWPDDAYVPENLYDVKYSDIMIGEYKNDADTQKYETQYQYVLETRGTSYRTKDYAGRLPSDPNFDTSSYVYVNDDGIKSYYIYDGTGANAKKAFARYDIDEEDGIWATLADKPLSSSEKNGEMPLYQYFILDENTAQLVKKAYNYYQKVNEYYWYDNGNLWSESDSLNQTPNVNEDKFYTTNKYYNGSSYEQDKITTYEYTLYAPNSSESESYTELTGKFTDEWYTSCPTIKGVDCRPQTQNTSEAMYRYGNVLKAETTYLSSDYFYYPNNTTNLESSMFASASNDTEFNKTYYGYYNTYTVGLSPNRVIEQVKNGSSDYNTFLNSLCSSTKIFSDICYNEYTDSTMNIYRGTLNFSYKTKALYSVDKWYSNPLSSKKMTTQLYGMSGGSLIPDNTDYYYAYGSSVYFANPSSERSDYGYRRYQKYFEGYWNPVENNYEDVTQSTLDNLSNNSYVDEANSKVYDINDKQQYYQTVTYGSYASGGGDVTNNDISDYYYDYGSSYDLQTSLEQFVTAKGYAYSKICKINLRSPDEWNDPSTDTVYALCSSYYELADNGYLGTKKYIKDMSYGWNSLIKAHKDNYLNYDDYSSQNENRWTSKYVGCHLFSADKCWWQIDSVSVMSISTTTMKINSSTTLDSWIWNTCLKTSSAISNDYLSDYGGTYFNNQYDTTVYKKYSCVFASATVDITGLTQSQRNTALRNKASELGVAAKAKAETNIYKSSGTNYTSGSYDWFTRLNYGTKYRHNYKWYVVDGNNVSYPSANTYYTGSGTSKYTFNPSSKTFTRTWVPTDKYKIHYTKYEMAWLEENGTNEKTSNSSYFYYNPDQGFIAGKNIMLTNYCASFTLKGHTSSGTCINPYAKDKNSTTANGSIRISYSGKYFNTTGLQKTQADVYYQYDLYKVVTTSTTLKFYDEVYGDSAIQNTSVNRSGYDKIKLEEFFGKKISSISYNSSSNTTTFTFTDYTTANVNWSKVGTYSTFTEYQKSYELRTTGTVKDTSLVKRTFENPSNNNGVYYYLNAKDQEGTTNGKADNPVISQSTCKLLSGSGVDVKYECNSEKAIFKVENGVGENYYKYYYYNKETNNVNSGKTIYYPYSSDLISGYTLTKVSDTSYIVTVNFNNGYSQDKTNCYFDVSKNDIVCNNENIVVNTSHPLSVENVTYVSPKTTDLTSYSKIKTNVLFSGKDAVRETRYNYYKTTNTIVDYLKQSKTGYLYYRSSTNLCYASMADAQNKENGFDCKNGQVSIDGALRDIVLFENELTLKNPYLNVIDSPTSTMSCPENSVCVDNSGVSWYKSDSDGKYYSQYYYPATANYVALLSNNAYNTAYYWHQYSRGVKTVYTGVVETYDTTFKTTVNSKVNNPEYFTTTDLEVVESESEYPQQNVAVNKNYNLFNITDRFTLNGITNEISSSVTSAGIYKYISNASSAYIKANGLGLTAGQTYVVSLNGYFLGNNAYLTINGKEIAISKENEEIVSIVFVANGNDELTIRLVGKDTVVNVEWIQIVLGNETTNVVYYPNANLIAGNLEYDSSLASSDYNTYKYYFKKYNLNQTTWYKQEVTLNNNANYKFYEGDDEVAGFWGNSIFGATSPSLSTINFDVSRINLTKLANLGVAPYTYIGDVCTSENCRLTLTNKYRFAYHFYHYDLDPVYSNADSYFTFDDNNLFALSYRDVMNLFKDVDSTNEQYKTTGYTDSTNGITYAYSEKMNKFYAVANYGDELTKWWDESTSTDFQTLEAFAYYLENFDKDTILYYNSETKRFYLKDISNYDYFKYEKYQLTTTTEKITFDKESDFSQFKNAYISEKSNLLPIFTDDNIISGDNIYYDESDSLIIVLKSKKLNISLINPYGKNILDTSYTLEQLLNKNNITFQIAESGIYKLRFSIGTSDVFEFEIKNESLKNSFNLSFKTKKVDDKTISLYNMILSSSNYANTEFVTKEDVSIKYNDEYYSQLFTQLIGGDTSKNIKLSSYGSTSININGYNYDYKYSTYVFKLLSNSPLYNQYEYYIDKGHYNYTPQTTSNSLKTIYLGLVKTEKQNLLGDDIYEYVDNELKPDMLYNDSKLYNNPDNSSPLYQNKNRYTTTIYSKTNVVYSKYVLKKNSDQQIILNNIYNYDSIDAANAFITLDLQSAKVGDEEGYLNTAYDNVLKFYNATSQMRNYALKLSPINSLIKTVTKDHNIFHWTDDEKWETMDNLYNRKGMTLALINGKEEDKDVEIFEHIMVNKGLTSYNYNNILYYGFDCRSTSTCAYMDDDKYAKTSSDYIGFAYDNYTLYSIYDLDSLYNYDIYDLILDAKIYMEIYFNLLIEKDSSTYDALSFYGKNYDKDWNTTRYFKGDDFEKAIQNSHLILQDKKLLSEFSSRIIARMGNNKFLYLFTQTYNTDEGDRPLLLQLFNTTLVSWYIDQNSSNSQVAYDITKGNFTVTVNYLQVKDLAEGYSGTDTSYKMMFQFIYNALSDGDFMKYYNNTYAPKNFTDKLGQTTTLVDVYKAMREYMISSDNAEYYILQKGNTLLIYIKDPEPYYENISLFTDNGGISKRNSYVSLGKAISSLVIPTNTGYLTVGDQTEPIPAVYLGGSIPHYHYQRTKGYYLSEHIISYIAYAGVTSGVKWTDGSQSTSKQFKSEDMAADYFSYNGSFKASDLVACKFDFSTVEGILNGPTLAKNCGLGGTYFQQLIDNYAYAIETRIAFDAGLVNEFELALEGLGAGAVAGGGSFLGNLVNDTLAGGSLNMEGFEDYWGDYLSETGDEFLKNSVHIKDMFLENWFAETVVLTQIAEGFINIDNQRRTFAYQMTDTAINSMVNAYLSSHALSSQKEAFEVLGGLLAFANDLAYTAGSYVGGYVKSAGVSVMCTVTKWLTWGTHTCHEEITYQTLFYTHRIANKVKYATFNQDAVSGSTTHNSFILDESAQMHYFNTNAYRYVSKLSLTETAKPELTRYIMQTPTAFTSDKRIKESDSFDNWIGYANSDFTKTYDYVHTYAYNADNETPNIKQMFVYASKTLMTSKNIGNYYKVEKDGKIYIQMANIYYGGDPSPDFPFVDAETQHDTIMDMYNGLTDFFHIDTKLKKFLRGDVNYDDYRLTFCFEKSFFEDNEELIMEDIVKFAGEDVGSSNGEEIRKGFFEGSTTGTSIVTNNLKITLSDTNELDKNSNNFKEIEFYPVSVTSYYIESEELASTVEEIKTKYNVDESKIFKSGSSATNKDIENFLRNSDNSVDLGNEKRYFVILTKDSKLSTYVENTLEIYRTLDLNFIQDEVYNGRAVSSLTGDAIKGVYQEALDSADISTSAFKIVLSDVQRKFVVGNAYTVATEGQSNLISALNFSTKDESGNYLKYEDNDTNENSTEFEIKVSNITLNLNNEIKNRLSSFGSISDYYKDGRSYAELSNEERQGDTSYYIDALGYLYVVPDGRYSWYAYKLKSNIDEIDKTNLLKVEGDVNAISHPSQMIEKEEGDVNSKKLYIWNETDKVYYHYPYARIEDRNLYWESVSVFDTLSNDDFTFIQNIEYSLYYHVNNNDNCLAGYIRSGSADNYLCYYNSGLTFQDIEQYDYYSTLINDYKYNDLLSIESHKIWNYTNAFTIDEEDGSIVLNLTTPIDITNLPSGSDIALSLRLRYINGNTSSNYTYAFTTSDDLVKNPYGTIFEEAFNTGSFANANSGLSKQLDETDYIKYMTDDNGEILDYIQNKEWMAENISVRYKEYLFTVMSNIEDECSIKFTGDELRIKECKSIPTKFHAKRHKDAEQVIGAKIMFRDENNNPINLSNTELIFTNDLLNYSSSYRVQTDKNSTFRIENDILYIENVNEIFGAHYRAYSSMNPINNMVEDYIMRYGGGNFFNIIVTNIEDLRPMISKKINVKYELYYRSTNELIYMDYNLNGKYEEDKPEFKAYNSAQNEATSEFYKLIENIPARYSNITVQLETPRMIKYDKSSGKYIIVPYEDSSNPIIIG